MSKVKDFIKAAAISGVVVPAAGVLAHVMEGGAFAGNDAKLSHRFECAYSLNPNPEHKTFTSYQYVDEMFLDSWLDKDGNPMNSEGMSCPDAWIEREYDRPCEVKFCNEEEYTANPFLTGAMYVAAAGLAYARIRRKKNRGNTIMPVQKTR